MLFVCLGLPVPSAKTFTVPVGGISGLPRDSELRFRQDDRENAVALAVRGKVTARVLARQDLLVAEKPQILKFGRSGFAAFWTTSATTYCREFVFIDGRRRALRHVGEFQNAWAPNFGKTGTVYEFPRIESRLETPPGKPFRWLRKMWKWDEKNLRFRLVGRRFIKEMPPEVKRRFQN